MNILVAGGAGFIGSNLCTKLIHDGNSVWAVDNFSTGTRSNIDHLRANKKFTFKECGIESVEFVEFCKNANIKFDYVFDLACPTGVPNIETLGEEMLEACSVGIRNILRVAHEHNARFLFTSSSEVYGDPAISPQAEEYTGNVDPIGWRANYEEGKRFGETWVTLFVKKYKLNASIVRLFNVYGPNMALSDFRVVPRFAVQAISGDPLTVHGQGTQERTMCYVDDILHGFMLVMEKGKSGEVYNLGSDQSISMLALAEKIIEATDSKSEIIFTPRATHDHESRMPDLSKIHALGWKQTISLEDGLKKTLEYFKEQLTHNTINSEISIE